MGSSIPDEFSALFGAEEELQFFLVNPLIPPSTSYASCRELLDSVSKLTSSLAREDPALTWFEVREIGENLNKFEVSLQADFGVRDTFIVSRKRAYSTTLLVESGESMVSEFSSARFPSLHQDMHGAGRCVAFELPTAAAFHIFRAVEASVQAYGVFVRKKPFTERERRGGIGSYSNCLKEKVLLVDERITGVIDHIASLYRNPTIHPEMHLSNTEVIGTLNIAVSVIDLIALDWKRREENPEVSLAEVLPDDSKIEVIATEVEPFAGPPQQNKRLLPKGALSGKGRKTRFEKSSIKSFATPSNTDH